MADVYTIDDLSSRDHLDTESDKPARLAVLGYPVAHSRSPQMQGAALAADGHDIRYIRLEVKPGSIKDAFQRMGELGFIGANVTVPLKLEAHDACDELDAATKAIGAVNSILLQDGKIYGFNTDGAGFAQAIREEFSVDLGNLRTAIIGAGGGAGQAIATQCVLEGCSKIVLVNRTASKVEELSKRLRNLPHDDRLEGPGERIVLCQSDSHGLAEQLAQCDLIVNATSLGLKPTDPLPLPAKLIEPHHLVYDAIYAPPVTPLLRAAAQHGSRTANGLSMLIHQGALAYQIWFGNQPSLPAMREALKTT